MIMFRKLLGIDDDFATNRLADLINVALHNRVARDLLQLRSSRNIFVANFAVISTDAQILEMKFAAQFIEVNKHPEARAISGEQFTIAIINIPARCGQNDAALALNLFLLAIRVRPKKLSVGEPTDEQQHEQADDRIEQ